MDDSARRQIMIVDDDYRIVAEILDALSSREEFAVRGFTNGADARAALQETIFDLVIADWKMPDVDGLTLIRDAQERSAQTVTVLMSAYNLHDAQEEPPAHHYLEKPFTLDELINLIDSIFPTPTQRRVKKPIVLKVLLGGDANVGKTSLIQRYCTGAFDPTRAMTIGVDFHLYDIEIEQEHMRLVVWDLGGQERFNLARQAFYRGAQAVGLVFDASNRTSFYNLIKWWRETREYLPDAPVLMLANKIDLPPQISYVEAMEVAAAWHIPFFQSSCANGEGVTEFFHALARSAWENTKNKTTAK
jgi:small GTP-binding protein